MLSKDSENVQFRVRQGFSASAPADEILAEVVYRRARGEYLPDSAVAKTCPHLMPGLGERLAALSGIHRSYLEARRAGPLSGPLLPLSESELETPIDSADIDLTEFAQEMPSIDGYWLLDEISFGGQANVYRAIHHSTGRKVAVKVLAGGPAAKSTSRTRFEREAQILATLDHPHIVKILDRGRAADGSFFLAMDYIQGYSLDEYWEVDPDGRMQNFPAILELFATIAQTLHDAHEHGVVHRDLKPSNIRLDRAGHPYILDFGLARLTGDAWAGQEIAKTVTESGQFVGSLPWTSPEQVLHGTERADARSDAYSLGVILYQVITHQFPYPVHNSIRDTLNHIVATVPESPSKLSTLEMGAAAAAVDTIVLKLLAKSPADRYATARELAEDLRRVSAGNAPKAVPRVRRRPRIFVFLLLLLLTGAITAWRMLPNKRDAADPVRTTSSRQPAFVNSIGMAFAYIPAGQFTLGSPETELGRLDDERQHLVRLSRDYLMAITEATQAQYEAIIGNNPSDPRGLGPNRPVQFVNWEDANEFCRRLSAQEGRVYRLPTEAEWEYACRAGSTGSFGGSGSLNAMGWYASNRTNLIPEVATKLPNAWGLFDMHGGVREWCSDYFGAFDVTAAQDPRGPPTGQFRVVRGGGVDTAWTACRSAYRIAADPVVKAPDLGFRVILEPDEQLRKRARDR